MKNRYATSLQCFESSLNKMVEELVIVKAKNRKAACSSSVNQSGKSQCYFFSHGNYVFLFIENNFTSSSQGLIPFRDDRRS